MPAGVYWNTPLRVSLNKAEMFNVWLKSSLSASWSDLITALRAMGEDSVASNIAATPSSSDEQLQSSAISVLEDLETLENDQYVSSGLEYENMEEDTDMHLEERRPRAVSIIEEDYQNNEHTKSGVVDSRRVSFIDEVISGCNLVTGITYRPTTTQDEKYRLYYTSKDYQNFALEEYYEREEMKVFSWEDFMVCESSEMNSKEEEEDRQDTSASHVVKEEGSIHKVGTLENLCYSSDTDVRSY